MFFAPSSVVACVSIWVNGIPVEQVCCVFDKPRHDGMLAVELDAIVGLQLEFDGSDLAHQCSVETFNASLCLWCVGWCLPNCYVAAHGCCHHLEQGDDKVFLVWLKNGVVENCMCSATFHQELLKANWQVLYVLCLVLKLDCHTHACFNVHCCEDWCCLLLS